MNNFTIITDSGCDIGLDILSGWGVISVSMTYKFLGEDKEYTNSDTTAKQFYNKMRAGAVAKTSAINIETFKDAFRKELADGRDVLYLGFSSGLSNTYNAGRLAAEDLLEEFPENRVIVFDTLCASSGHGLLVKLAVDKKNSGATIEEVARYVTQIRPNLCHWFTVDDLKYLKRGGRVSPTAAFFGGMLNIKPVLHVDDAGKLIPVAKVRGRKATLKVIADKFSELALDGDKKIFISHADCIEDAEEMKRILEERGGNVELISDIGAVIGAHSGPGTLAIFYLGKNR